ncbi:unnamed protein product [Closterium sp. NIES-65]|nr:unnamed protein product [Closterium sp. NIES-65]
MTTCPTRLTSPSTSANHVRAANSTKRPSTLSVPLTKLARRERHARGSRELHLAVTTSRSSRSGSRSSVATPTAPTSVPLTQLLRREGLTPASLGLHLAPQVEAGAGLAAGRQAARQAKRQAGRQAGDAQRASRARAHQWRREKGGVGGGGPVGAAAGPAGAVAGPVEGDGRSRQEGTAGPSGRDGGAVTKGRRGRQEVTGPRRGQAAGPRKGLGGAATEPSAGPRESRGGAA